MTKQEIQKEIAELKEEMKNVHGTPCTVWSRVVGYLRPVQGWNKGKKEEFSLRKKFKAEEFLGLYRDIGCKTRPSWLFCFC